MCSVDYRLIEALARRMPEPHPAIVDLSPQNLWEVLDDLRRVGEAVGQPGAGQRAIDGLRGRIEAVAALARERLAAGAARPRCLVAEWTDPIFVGGHWTPQIVHMAGGEHVLNPGRCAVEARKGGKQEGVSICVYRTQWWCFKKIQLLSPTLQGGWRRRQELHRSV